MRRLLISILLAIVFASIPVFAESREAHLIGFARQVISAAPAGGGYPQMRHRMYRIGRRRHYRVRRYRVRRYRVRRYRVRHYRRIYVRRRRRY
jgi:hypothetical protein